MVERRFLEHHSRDDCQKRIVTCEHCKKEIRQEQLVDHWNACGEYPLECPNLCGKKNITREKVRVDGGGAKYWGGSAQLGSVHVVLKQGWKSWICAVMRIIKACSGYDRFWRLV